MDIATTKTSILYMHYCLTKIAGLKNENDNTTVERFEIFAWWYCWICDLQSSINFARANFPIWDALSVTIFSVVCAQLCSGEDQWVGRGDKKTSVQSLTPPAMVFKLFLNRIRLFCFFHLFSQPRPILQFNFCQLYWRFLVDGMS